MCRLGLQYQRLILCVLVERLRFLISLADDRLHRWPPRGQNEWLPTSAPAIQCQGKAKPHKWACSGLSISTMSTSIHDGLHPGSERSRRRVRNTPKMAAKTWPTASRPQPCTAQHLKESVASQQPHRWTLWRPVADDVQVRNSHILAQAKIPVSNAFMVLWLHWRSGSMLPHCFS